MRLNEVRNLLLGLTNRCNGSCIMCWHSNKIQHYHYDLPIRIYEHIKDRLFPRIRFLNLSGGGEILLYPNIDKVLSDIKHYKFKTSITSNFSDISDTYRNKLKDINVEFVVSLDGSNKQLQEFLRPNCDYDKVIDNIKYFKAHRKRITIQTTISDYNLYDMDKLIALGNNLGVDVIKFQEVQYLGNLDKPYKFKKPIKDIDYVTKVLSNKTKIQTAAYLDFYRKPLLTIPKEFNTLYRLWPFKNTQLCQNTQDTLKIQENGQVLSCCVPYSKVMGDLRYDLLETIIGSKEFEENRVHCQCPMRKG